MTKAEFIKRRQIAHHLKTHGVTICAPVEPPEENLTAQSPHQRNYRRGSGMLRVGVRMVQHSLDPESGEARPVTVQRLRRGKG